MLLIDKRERWGLTLWGWLAALILVGMALVGGARNIHGFLATDSPVRGEVLVVEGWIPDYAILGAVSEFKGNGYRLLIAVGGPIAVGSHVSGFKSYAELARVRLKASGIDCSRMVVLETEGVARDRTFQSAIAVKAWASSDLADLRGLDVYTLGAHARRSRLLYRKALGDEVAVGVIAAGDENYDPNAWWTSSSGVRTVLGEAIAYGYAVVLGSGF